MWETAIVRYLQEQGFRYAERRRMNGIHDRGDIAGLPGVVIEAKNVARFTLSEWADEATIEAVNDASKIGVIWAHRPRKSSPGDGYVIMNGSTFIELLKEGGW